MINETYKIYSVLTIYTSIPCVHHIDLENSVSFFPKTRIGLGHIISCTFSTLPPTSALPVFSRTTIPTAAFLLATADEIIKPRFDVAFIIIVLVFFFDFYFIAIHCVLRVGGKVPRNA
jgi:hypothetical protein